MATKLTALLPILLLIGIIFVSGCTSSEPETKYICPDGITTVANVSLCPKTTPTSELLVLSPGEITQDSFGNTYSVTGFGYEGIDIIVNDRVGYLHVSSNGDCIGLYTPDNTGLTCYGVPYVRVYLKAWDYDTKKATIEVVKR